jgi:hypothetical protein
MHGTFWDWDIFNYEFLGMVFLGLVHSRFGRARHRHFRHGRSGNLHCNPAVTHVANGVDSATWYSTHTCSTSLRFSCENGAFI